MDGKLEPNSMVAVARTCSRAAAMPVVLSAASVLGFCMLTALGAQVRIYVTPDVPITLQTLAVMLAGFTLPPARAAAALGLYLAIGAMYLPFFAGSAGLLGPTGGYLVGFLVAAPLISLLRGSGRASVVRLFLAGMAGSAAFFLLGVGWMAIQTGDLVSSLGRGLVPFIPINLVKIMMAVSIVVSFRGLHESGRRRSWW